MTRICRFPHRDWTSPSLPVVWSGTEACRGVTSHLRGPRLYKAFLQQTLRHHWLSQTTQNGRVFSFLQLLHTKLLELPELRLWNLQHLISWNSFSYFLHGLLSFSPASKQLFSTSWRSKGAHVRFITSGQLTFPCWN